MWRPDLRAKVSSTAPTKTSAQKGNSSLEDTAAQIIEVPAGLTEEAMERAVVFELGQLRGLDDAGQGTAARTEDPSAGQGPKGAESGSCEAGLEGE